jgi:RNA polymerase sigma-70 factor (ECF subfamily)
MTLVRSDATPFIESPSGVPDLETLYRTHATAVARWAAKLAGPLVDVDDLVHEIFLVVRRRLPEFRGDAKVTTWLYRITERVAQESRRKDRFRRWFSRARHLEIERTTAPPHLTPLDEVERRQSGATVYRILDRLPAKYRNVLILFELEELSGEEIATLTGLNPATVWVHLHRARARFIAEMKRDSGRST